MTLAGLRRALEQWQFDRATRRVFETAPIACDPSAATVVVSQVCRRDLQMALVALKSFLRFVPVGRVVVVADRTLDADSEQTLRHHLPDVRVVPVDRIDAGRCPRDGTWERLIQVVECSADAYTVQIDADTLTLRAPVAIREHIDTGTSFTLGTRMGRTIERMVDVEPDARARSTSPDDPVQLVAEASFGRLADFETLRYVRGCAALTGFARGVVGRDEVETFSVEMETLLGPGRWRAWGSEQVASNVLVASAPGAVVLPVEEYETHRGDPGLDQCTFVHFIGTDRFARGTYARLARRVIGELVDAGGDPAPAH